MGILDTISGWLGGGSSSAETLFIVDGKGVLFPRGGGRPGPRDMMDLMRRLGRFAAHEKVGMICAFEAQPLRTVADGDEFSGVTVYYADTAARLTEVMKDLIKRHRNRRLIVVTAEAAIEQQAESAGARPLRPATFRKALEPAGGGEPGEQRGGGPSGPPRRRNRGPRGHGGPGRGPRPNGTDSGPRGPDAPPSEPRPPSSASGGGRPASDLIDLVE
ncbi:MAG: NYN domain-containing protein [Kiritimatiellae bacterium]|nr:NYN domain-containing protein [Kiritimatiellia bacterium]